ncbi:uncharacterized protein LOC112493748 [Cephus cinctus]|uniref:Uncharacterized protein LOC112493748 n=1 Tax=Cephus cinctus TaxID=211228 RepID=A0AAJ7R9M3_CEPCN|nr:uncharacterized protein LOC112493748 [Cephus cinctus]
MTDKEKIPIELLFSKGNSINHYVKVKEFWKFLNTQEGFHPYKPPRITVMKEQTISDCNSALHFHNLAKLEESKSIWHTVLQTFHDSGLDQTALTTADTCKLCLIERHLRNDKESIRDAKSKSGEEMKCEIEAFGRRITKNTNPCAYATPKKYQHLIH